MEYSAVAFRQNQNSPLQVTFVAAASSIDSWARVPTRMSNSPSGIQRPVIPAHVDEIEKFFSSDDTKTNASPTNILLGIEPEHQKDIKLLAADGTELDLDTVKRDPVQCTVRIGFAPWQSEEFENEDLEIAELFEKSRVKYEEAGHIDEKDPDEPSLDEDELDEDIVSPETEITEEDEDELDDQEDEENTDVSASEKKKVEEADISSVRNLTPHQVADVCNTKKYKTWSPRKKNALTERLKDDRKIGLIVVIQT